MKIQVPILFLLNICMGLEASKAGRDHKQVGRPTSIWRNEEQREQ